MVLATLAALVLASTADLPGQSAGYHMYSAPPDSTLHALREADQARLFRVPPLEVGNYQNTPPEFGTHGQIADYFIARVGRLIHGNQLKALREMLIPEVSYRVSENPRDFKLCEFHPRHAVRFEGEARSAEVLICLECEQLRFVGGGGGDFDPVALRLSGFFAKDGSLSGP